MDSPDIVWRPDPETASRTRIARFMQQHGCASLEALQQRSVEDIAWYWDAVSRDLGMALVHAVSASGRHVPWRAVAALVCRWHDESGSELR